MAGTDELLYKLPSSGFPHTSASIGACEGLEGCIHMNHAIEASRGIAASAASAGVALNGSSATSIQFAGKQQEADLGLSGA